MYLRPAENIDNVVFTPYVISLLRNLSVDVIRLATYYLEVGLESGKMIGGVSLSFMALRTSSLNRPPQADRPIRMVGLTLLTVSSRLMPSISASETAKLERS